ncbi:MAG TPA: UBP-type zinc finger domain-containing protein [Acidimicrobiia bacterium]|jgi:hypothetical protein
MTIPCDHLATMPVEPMPAGGCGPCLADGGRWVHLRFCTGCGATFCCDDSTNRHASRHHTETGHPVVRSKEPGEDWAWCYVDRQTKEPVAR